jgi:pimeloyl-ACP methyl ester carboxylesterase
MPYARTDDGVKIYYETHGPGRDVRPRAGPLVLAYGIGGNADLWDVNLGALATGRRVVLWEPRGHARSDSPEDPAKYSFRRWALDLRDVLDHLRIRRAHVGGLSLGAGIALASPCSIPPAFGHCS